MRLTQMVEALLFASDAPLTAADLTRIDERLDEDTVAAIIDELRDEYERTERSFQIREVAGGYQLLTRPEYAVVLDRFETVPQSARLSAPALEVLAIVAYRQPIGRIEIEEIRGVQSAAVLRTLQDRELIEPVARGEGLGRPLLYGTTRRFLEHFGFNSLEDLPRPDELPVVLRSVEPQPAEVAEAFGPRAMPAEPRPLSDEAEHEAEALHLHVPSARTPGEEEALTVRHAAELAAVIASIAGEAEADETDGAEPDATATKDEMP